MYNMIPKHKRLTTSLFKEVFLGGKSVFGPQISLVYIKQNENQHSRFSFSVSKKVAKTAVLRNRIRRRGYVALAPLLSTETVPVFGVLVVKKDISDLTIEQIRILLQDLLKRI